jgi:hypothetical protein
MVGVFLAVGSIASPCELGWLIWLAVAYSSNPCAACSCRILLPLVACRLTQMPASQLHILAAAQQQWSVADRRCGVGVLQAARQRFALQMRCSAIQQAAALMVQPTQLRKWCRPGVLFSTCPGVTAGSACVEGV